MLNGLPGKRIGWPETPAEQWRCVQAQALKVALPPDLERCALQLGTPPKDTEGHRVMLTVSKPRRHNLHPRWTPKNAPDKFVKLYTYNLDDVTAEHAISHKLPTLPAREQKLWQHTHVMNARGVPVDLEVVHRFKDLSKQQARAYEQELWELTDYSVEGFTKRDALVEWLNDNGLNTTSVKKDVIESYLRYPEGITPNVQRVLELRAKAGKTALKKLDSVLEHVNDDCRVRGALRYHGAAPGRYSSLGVQWQNFVRGFGADMEDAVLDILDRPVTQLELLYGDLGKMLSDALRGIVCAPGGYDIISGDYNKIELFVGLWLAGQFNEIDFLRDGGDLYEDIGRSVGTERQVGKTLTLAGIYQIAGNGFRERVRIETGIEIPEEDAHQFIKRFRRRMKKVRDAWYAVEDAVRLALEQPGKTVAWRHLRFRYSSKPFPALQMQLPSKRVIWFPFMREVDGELQYFHRYRGQSGWGMWSTYGGSIFQSATQGIARCILANGILAVEEAGPYLPYLTVHDQVDSLVQEGEGSVYEVLELLCSPLGWGDDNLVVQAEGWRGKRNRK